MKNVLVVAAIGLAVPVLGATLTVESGAYWVQVPLPSINSFFGLANQTIRFVNERLEGNVPTLGTATTALGLRVGEGYGDTWKLGFHLVLAQLENGTSGSWRQGEQEFPVRLGVGVGLSALELEFALWLVPELIQVGVFGGVGLAQVRYTGQFPQNLPTDWTLPFTPPVGDEVYAARSWVGGLFARLFLPVRLGVAVGAEVGVRFARLGVPIGPSSVLDLNRDGLGDVLDFTALWLGLVVKLSFPL